MLARDILGGKTETASVSSPKRGYSAAGCEAGSSSNERISSRQGAQHRPAPVRRTMSLTVETPSRISAVMTSSVTPAQWQTIIR
jgi:hypothetical protein